jgi:hypothetical protein
VNTRKIPAKRPFQNTALSGCVLGLALSLFAGMASIRARREYPQDPGETSFLKRSSTELRFGVFRLHFLLDKSVL